jgi:large subunit ribosomal protein L17
MRHQLAGYKLSRDHEHRRALRRNLAVALFTHGQITTTIPKAKSVQPFVEKLITAARKGDLASRRRVIAELQDRIMVKDDTDEGVTRNKYGELQDGPRVVKKLFDQIAPKYHDRSGGYTRIIRLARHRIGDASDLCVLQLVGEEEVGPQVSGQYSRRRDKAHHRTEFAAKLRKGKMAGVGEQPAGLQSAAEGGGEAATV